MLARFVILALSLSAFTACLGDDTSKPDDSAEAQLLLHVQVNGFTPDDGVNPFGLITVTFHCGDVPPEDGAEYTAEEWLVGDMGTVLHVVAEADFVLE